MDNSLCKSLPWDTKFFGFSVGSIDLTSVIGGLDKLSENLSPAIASSSHHLIYIHSQPDAKDVNKFITGLGSIHVDTRIVYQLDLTHTSSLRKSESTTPVDIFTGPNNDELVQLALIAGKHSRFNTDPMIKKSDFERLYQLWIEQSVQGLIAEQVAVTRNSSGVITGMITLSRKNKVGNIGLLAVSATEQGKGIGSLLLNHAVDYFTCNNCSSVTVVTQNENRGACSHYQKWGFTESIRSNTYHLWQPNIGCLAVNT